MKKIFLITTFLTSFLTVNAQDATGIRFGQQLKWSEILARAKADHKYIFVDCYATWCGPCKYMDATVYPQKAVGEIYNSNFISLKVQMDSTAADDSLTKSRYGRATMFATSYHVEAYPTFLFFDPDGNPVHKVSGAQNAQQFIQLAKDARNPEKQFYSILKNFRPGQLDTSELKGLARSFRGTRLGGRLALDYLTRIPKKQLSLTDNGLLMAQFQYNDSVAEIAINYCKSLSRRQFASASNETFMYTLDRLPGIDSLMLAYVNGLSENEMYDKVNLSFLAECIDYFKKPQNRWFKFVYQHTGRLDTIMKAVSTNWAEGFVENIIYSECSPQIEKTKQTGKTPDFDAMSDSIKRKYNAYYAERVIAEQKFSWYHDRIKNNETQYWPQYIEAQIEQEKEFWHAGVLTMRNSSDINNTCNDIFLHSNDAVQINLATTAMNKVVALTHDPDEQDTYACVLYKDRHPSEALAVLQQIMQFCIDNKAKGTAGRTKRTTDMIAAIKNGKKIWEMPEFQ